MTDPEGAMERKRLRDLEREIQSGAMPKPMLIKKDSHGETHIEEVKGQHNLTIDRIR